MQLNDFAAMLSHLPLAQELHSFIPGGHGDPSVGHGNPLQSVFFTHAGAGLLLGGGLSLGDGLLLGGGLSLGDGLLLGGGLLLGDGVE